MANSQFGYGKGNYYLNTCGKSLPKTKRANDCIVCHYYVTNILVDINYLGLFSKISAVVELPVVGFFFTERNLGLKLGGVEEGLSPRDLRLKSPVE